MNWAPKLALKSSSFFSAKRCLDLAVAAEDLDERVAGVALLDLRVQRAGVRPLRDEQLLRALARSTTVMPRVSGTVTSAISASSGEITNIITSTPTTVSSDDDQLAQRLLQALRDVVDVVRDPAEQLAARHLVEVGQRQPVDLRLDVRRSRNTVRCVTPLST